MKKSLRQSLLAFQFLTALSTIQVGAPLALAQLPPTPDFLSADTPIFRDDQTVFAIGDIHGDLNILKKIIFATGFVDANLHLTNPRAHLVLTGDYVDRGPDTREVLDFLIQLRNRHPNRVHILMGNHERDRVFGVTSAAPESDAPFLYSLFTSGPYAEFLATLPIVKRVGPFLFVHGGFELDFIFVLRGEGLNSLNRRSAINLRFAQQVLDREQALLKLNFGTKIDEIGKRIGNDFSVPLEQYLWNTSSPLRTRTFSPGEMSRFNSLQEISYGPWPYDREQSRRIRSENRWTKDQFLNEVLRVTQTRRLIVGHTITRDREEMVASPYFGDRLSSIDVENSGFYGPHAGAFLKLDLRSNIAEAYEVDRVTGVPQKRDEVVDAKKRELKRLKYFRPSRDSAFSWNQNLPWIDLKPVSRMTNTTTGETRVFDENSQNPNSRLRSVFSWIDTSMKRFEGTNSLFCSTLDPELHSFGHVMDRRNYPELIKRHSVNLALHFRPDLPTLTPADMALTLVHDFVSCIPGLPCLEKPPGLGTFRFPPEWKGYIASDVYNSENVFFFYDLDRGNRSANDLIRNPNIHVTAPQPAPDGSQRLTVTLLSPQPYGVNLIGSNGWETSAVRRTYHLRCVKRDEIRRDSFPAAPIR